jgi:hypothetical protein
VKNGGSSAVYTRSGGAYNRGMRRSRRKAKQSDATEAFLLSPKQLAMMRLLSEKMTSDLPEYATPEELERCMAIVEARIDAFWDTVYASLEAETGLPFGLSPEERASVKEDRKADRDAMRRKAFPGLYQ